MRAHLIAILTIAWLGVVESAALSAEPRPTGSESHQQPDGYIGMAFNVARDRDHVVIMSVETNSPAERAGLKGGDILLEIDGVAWSGNMSTTELSKLLSGPAGSDLAFKIQREGAEAPLILTVIRSAKPGHVEALPTDSKRLALRVELEAMLRADQAHRQEIVRLQEQLGAESAAVKALWAKQLEIDSDNMTRLEEIISEQGWPRQSEVGSDAATGAFIVLQHADLFYQKKYLPLLRKAAEAGDFLRQRLALLEDRILTHEGKKQIYGTQLRQNEAGEIELHPVDDEAQLDERRAAVGLPPIKDYLKNFGVPYEGSDQPSAEPASPAP